MKQKMNIIDEAEELISSLPPTVEEKALLIHQIIEELAQTYPNAVAIEDHSQPELRNWTYEEFNSAANALSRRILSVSGGRLELPVSILLESRVKILIASLAALKAGCSFVPLSTQYPLERIKHILTELSKGQEGLPPVLITEEEKLVKDLGDIPFQRVEFIESKSNEENLSLPIPTNNLAYIVFTSGSTGAPKGVMVEHSALIPRLRTFTRSLCITEEDRGTLLLNPAFDASFLESWALLFTGATLVALPEATRKSPEAFKLFADEQRITRAVVPTSFAERLWASSSSKLKAELPTLKTLLVGGEQLPALPFSWKELPYEVLNGYGPTECVVQVSAYNVTREEGKYEKSRPPLGFPMPGVEFKLAKVEGLENEEEGELCIGGSELARGYWGNPQLTGKKFLTDPTTGQRWYRTGDLVSFSPISGYTFLRRVDDQVKVGGGFLVEPAEIERTILEGLGGRVNGVKVIPVNRNLIAFVSSELSEKELTSLVKSTVSTHLPSYMVPAFVLAVSSFPTTPHGKVDKVALEKTFNSWLEQKGREKAGGESNKTPQSSIEKKLTSLWSRVLQLPEKVISSAQDMFSVGADSLQLSEMGALIKKELGLEVPLDFLSKVTNSGGALDMKQMAGLLAQKERTCPLVKLGDSQEEEERDENGNEKPVLLFLHPEAGTLFCYKALQHRLALSLSNYELYGIHDPDLLSYFNHSSQFQSVHEMATYYAERVRAKFPHRRVILAGYQFGGFLAWELAALLGQSVEAVFLFDSQLQEVNQAEEERLVKEYEASRRLTKGIKAPLPVIRAGVHKYRLGLNYKPSSLKAGPEVILFGHSNLCWPNSFLEGKKAVTFYEIETKEDSMLEEPNAFLIENFMRVHINRVC